MKKKIFGGIAIVAIAVAMAFNVTLSNQKQDKASMLALANVEALAQDGEIGVWDWQCRTDVSSTNTYQYCGGEQKLASTATKLKCIRFSSTLYGTCEEGSFSCEIDCDGNCTHYTSNTTTYNCSRI